MSQKEICELSAGNAKIRHENKGFDRTIIFVNGYKDNSKEQLRFEWDSSTKHLNANRIFVLGTKSLWYHDCIDYLIREVKPLVEGKKALTVGASMGGYGALIMAHSLGCASITFGPQTNITREFLRLDPRWETALIRVNEITTRPDLLDLSFIKGDHHHIYFSNKVPLDCAHANMMDCKLFPYDCETHNVAGKLKANGILGKLIEERINSL